MSALDGDVRPRATIRDVAALAGVSLKTVSRVINGESGVSAELTARVRDAAERLDFRPNLGARSLRRSDGKTATIGLLLEDVSNPFSAAIHRAIENVARSRGVAVFTASVDEDPERERALVRALVARRVDGLVMVPAGGDQSYLHNEVRAGLSLVFLDRPPAYLDGDVVLAATRTVPRTRSGISFAEATGGSRTSATCCRSPPPASGMPGTMPRPGKPASR